jgi:hypothetical protein
MRRDPDHHSDELEPPEWINSAGHEYRAWRAFEGAREQIRKERVLQLVRAPERLATKEEMERVRLGPPRRREESSTGSAFPPPERGGVGSAAAVVVITTALALATTMALLVYLLVSLVGS